MNKLSRLALLLALAPFTALPAVEKNHADQDRRPARARFDEEAKERRGKKAQEPEADDATARRQAMKDWFGEWTPEYRQFVMDAAAREREVNGSMIPGSGRFMPVKVAGNNWTNLGPTNASKEINGVTLNVRDSGRPVAIVVDPTDSNVIYDATAGGGVWKSTDAGATWSPITEALGSLSCGALAIDPANHNTLYLGLGDAFDGTGIGLFKSVDGGATWTGPVYLGTSTVINAIGVSASDPLKVLVATNGGLYRSTDGGATFTKIAIATGTGVDPTCWTLAWGGSTNWALSLESNPAATSGTGEIWYTTDDGATWTKSTGFTQATVGLTRASIASAPSSRTTMYAYAAGYSTWGASDAASDMADMYRSTDGGHTWTALGTTAGYKSATKSYTIQYTNTNTDSKYPGNILGGQAWYNQMIIVDPTSASTFYVGGNLNLAKVTSATTTPSYAVQSNWLAQYTQPYVHADFHAAAFAPDGTLYMGTDGGIFKRTNAGTNTWTSDLNIGITSHLIYSVGSSPANTNAVLGGFQDNGTRVRVNATSVFDQTLGGDGFGCHIHQIDATKMVGSLYNSRVYKSTDSGQTWTAATGISDTNGTVFTVKVVPGLADATGNTLYTFTNTKVFKSTNYGTSFTAMGITGFPAAPFYLRNVGAAKSNGSVVGIVKNAGEVYITTNGGTSWTKAAALPNNGLSLSYISFGQTDANVVYVASVAGDGTKNHLWKSTNGGTSWTAIDGSAASPNGLPFGIPINAVVEDPNDSQTIYAGTHLGVYRSTDGGASWRRFGAGLPLVSVTDFYITPNSNLMRISTFGRGFWEFNTNTGTVTATIATPATNLTVNSGQSVSFSGSATDKDPASDLTYGWTFGDGGTASGTSASHSWTNNTGTDQVYTVTFTATGSTGGLGSSTRTITVKSVDTIAPVVAAPTASGSRKTITISTTATDNIGVTKVEFFLSGSLIGTATTGSPFSVTFDTTTKTDGGYIITSKAYDAAGNVTTSAQTSLQIDNTAPSGTFSESGTSGNITLSASASDATSGIYKVTYYLDGQFLASRYSSPYTVTYDSTLLSNGTHTFVAYTQDYAGNTAYLSPSSIQVNINNPIWGTLTETGTTGIITFSGTAYAAAGVNRVVFYLDGAYLATRTSAPYEVSYDSTKLVNGSHSITAYAVDNLGNMAYLNPRKLSFTTAN